MFGRLSLSLLLCQAVLIAQTGNSVTVTASQTAAQPDSVVFSVAVISGLNQNLEVIVNAVSSLGITAANLTGLSVPYTSSNPTPRAGPGQEQWTFQLGVSFTQMKSTVAALLALQKSISAAGLSLSWTVTGTQTSATAAATCNLPNLAAQASAEAQQIASAASVKLGAIGSLSVSTSSCSLTASYALSTAQPAQRILAATASLPWPSAPPDQVMVDIYISSGFTATLSGVTAALTKAGIGGTTFFGVAQNSQPSPLGPALTWTFTQTIPLANLAPTLAHLTAGERNLGAGLTLAFGPSGVSYSQPPACPEPGLFSAAQTLAQNAAAATGASVGSLLSMSNGATAQAAAEATFLLAVPINSELGASCSLTAQFQLL